MQGLAAAAAARDAAKRKRESEEATTQPAKRRAAAPSISKAILHEVQLPKDFDHGSQQHDPAQHGTGCSINTYEHWRRMTSGVELLLLYLSWATKPMMRSFTADRVPIKWSAPSHPCPGPLGDMNNPKWTGKMAKQYPFTLDPFQSTSIACLVRS